MSGLVETPTVVSGYIMINMTFSKIWCHFCICAYHYHHNDYWMHHQAWQPTEEIWKCISYHRTSKTFTELQIVIMMRTLINLICFQAILKVSSQFGNFENDLENLVMAIFHAYLLFEEFAFPEFWLILNKIEFLINNFKIWGSKFKGEKNSEIFRIFGYQKIYGSAVALKLDIWNERLLQDSSLRFRRFQAMNENNIIHNEKQIK